jgi:hypothetical protein
MHAVRFAGHPDDWDSACIPPRKNGLASGRTSGMIRPVARKGSANSTPTPIHTMNTPSLRTFLPAAMAAAVLGLLSGFSHAADAAIGQPLDIKFHSVDGKDVDLAKLKGKVVLVDFWATWCGQGLRI